MENSTLIKALQTLNKAEFREFGRFVESPFYNGRKEVFRFFKLIKNDYPHFNSISNEKIFISLYPGKDYKPDVIRKLSSFLYKLFEEYLSVTAFKDDNFYFRQGLLIQLITKRLYRNYEKELKFVEKDLEDLKGESEFYYWKKFLIERSKNTYYMLSGKDHKAADSIIMRSDLLSFHFIIIMSKTMLSLAVNEKNFNTNMTVSEFFNLFKMTDIEGFIEKLEASGNNHYAFPALYFYQVKSFMEINNNLYFQKYKELMFSNIKRFNYLDKLNLFTMYEAICTLKIEQGDTALQNDLFEAYNSMLKMNLYSFNEGGEFIVKLFRNFILTGIQLKKYEWLEDFLKQYTAKLPVESRINMTSLAEAMLLFEKKEFPKSLEKLSKIDYEMFHFKIDIKNVQLKNYYELNHYEEAYSFIDSYKHFISGNKFISERYKVMAGNFIEIVKKLLKAKEKDSKEDAYLIEKEILSFKNIIFREWLNEKINELKN